MAQPDIVPAGAHLNGERGLKAALDGPGEALISDVSQELEVSCPRWPNLDGRPLAIQGSKPRRGTDDLLGREVTLEDERPVRCPCYAEVESFWTEGFKLPSQGVFEL